MIKKHSPRDRVKMQWSKALAVMFASVAMAGAYNPYAHEVELSMIPVVRPTPGLVVDRSCGSWSSTATCIPVSVRACRAGRMIEREAQRVVAERAQSDAVSHTAYGLGAFYFKRLAARTKVFHTTSLKGTKANSMTIFVLR